MSDEIFDLGFTVDARKHQRSQLQQSLLLDECAPRIGDSLTVATPHHLSELTKIVPTVCEQITLQKHVIDERRSVVAGVAVMRHFIVEKNETIADEEHVLRYKIAMNQHFCDRDQPLDGVFKDSFEIGVVECGGSIPRIEPVLIE